MNRPSPNPSSSEQDALREALKPFAEKAEYADALEAADDDYVDCAPFKAGDYRKARAALTASVWQPIETAPKDRWILAAEASWEPGVYDAYAAHYHSDGYWMARCGQYVTQSPEPTHWMPLPDPPSLSNSVSGVKL
jgi:hypothetical protein